MHWFAIDIWEFFERFNSISSCSYRYIWRLDEDSFIHSPIQNDLFEVMRSKDYLYGYRMCSYEMKVSRRMWTWWSKRHKNFSPYRDLDLDMCGFYNNFFVADLEFFRSPEVAMFLRFIDKMGHIYRKRLGDLMIHSMVAYAFAPPERIHRFLDFTYEHSTLNKTSGCLIWGGIQAGANDTNAQRVMDEYYAKYALDLNCPVNASYLGSDDLSPLYSHLSPLEKTKISLHTITAGSVELPSGKGPLSG
jgi:alpha 1,2-mannosyltransferase